MSIQRLISATIVVYTVITTVKMYT